MALYRIPLRTAYRHFFTPDIRTLEDYKEKLLDSHANASNSSILKEEFLLLAYTYFKPYFSECFHAKLEEVGGARTEVRVLVLPPEEDQPVLISLTRLNFDNGLEAVTSPGGQEDAIKISIADICSIAIKEDGESLELNRKNGIPLILTGLTETKALLSVLCGYYRQSILHLKDLIFVMNRLGEKWTFSLCSELVWPCIQKMLEGHSE